MRCYKRAPIVFILSIIFKTWQSELGNILSIVFKTSQFELGNKAEKLLLWLWKHHQLPNKQTSRQEGGAGQYATCQTLIGLHEFYVREREGEMEAIDYFRISDFCYKCNETSYIHAFGAAKSEKLYWRTIQLYIHKTICCKLINPEKIFHWAEIQILSLKTLNPHSPN